jgi:uncharacterized membrane protein
VPVHCSFELWRGSRSGVLDFVQVYGLSGLLALAGAAALRPQVTRPRMWLAGILALALLSSPALALLALGGIAAAALWRRSEPETRFVLLLALAAIALLAVAELVVLRGDVSRMNTVFKFHYQAWLLLGLVGAWGAASLCGRLRGRARAAAAGGVALLAATGLLYPLTAIPARAADRFLPAAGPTWNGWAFLERAVLTSGRDSFPLAPDLAAVRWLNAHARGTPVIAEMNTFPLLYGWGNRISTHTGLPAIAGWDWHVRQTLQPATAESFAQRIRDTQEIFRTGDPDRAWRLLRQYEAEWVIVGALERSYSSPGGIAKFAAAAGRYWERAFAAPGVEVYRVYTQERGRSQL